MVISSQHNRTNFTLANHFIKLQCNTDSPLFILIQDTRLRPYHELIFLRIANPNPVVFILETAIRVNASHCRFVCFTQILGFAAKTHPAEGAVAKVKQ